MAMLADFSVRVFMERWLDLLFTMLNYRILTDPLGN